MNHYELDVYGLNSYFCKKNYACIEVLRHLDTPETRPSGRTLIPIGAGKQDSTSREYQ